MLNPQRTKIDYWKRHPLPLRVTVSFYCPHSQLHAFAVCSNEVSDPTDTMCTSYQNVSNITLLAVVCPYWQAQAKSFCITKTIFALLNYTDGLSSGGFSCCFRGSWRVATGDSAQLLRCEDWLLEFHGGSMATVKQKKLAQFCHGFREHQRRQRDLRNFPKSEAKTQLERLQA